MKVIYLHWYSVLKEILFAILPYLIWDTCVLIGYNKDILNAMNSAQCVMCKGVLNLHLLLPSIDIKHNKE